MLVICGRGGSGFDTTAVYRVESGKRSRHSDNSDAPLGEILAKAKHLDIGPMLLHFHSGLWEGDQECWVIGHAGPYGTYDKVLDGADGIGYDLSEEEMYATEEEAWNSFLSECRPKISLTDLDHLIELRLALLQSLENISYISRGQPFESVREGCWDEESLRPQIFDKASDTIWGLVNEIERFVTEKINA